MFEFYASDLVFSDGGCIQRNPSSMGGTWAYCVVRDGTMVVAVHGVVIPEEIGMPFVTNNLTELLAALKALEAMPNGWDGTLHTDSQVTIYRLTGSKKFAGIPQPMVGRVQAVLNRLGRFKCVLLDGHPTKKQLEAGIGKRGHAVSKFNKLCDELCNQAGWEFLGKMAEKAESPLDIAGWHMVLYLKMIDKVLSTITTRGKADAVPDLLAHDDADGVQGDGRHVLLVPALRVHQAV